jgi:hypothetical protein
MTSDPQAPSGGAEPADEEGANGDAKAADASTHFLFKHRLFSVKGAHFAVSPATDEPVYNVTMGELKVSLTIPTLAAEFGLGADTDDGKLLRIVARSLRYVKQIRPGDSIPREILDGTSSWTVEPHHQTVAIARLSYNLINPRAAGEFEANEFQVLNKMANDEETKNAVSGALVDIAQKERQGRETKEMIYDQLETVARELAYIEALRERQIFEDVGRIQALLRGPMQEFPSIFQMVYTQMADVRQVLRDIPRQIQFIRTMRDELHVRFMKWEELIQLWEPIATERSETLEKALRTTYRFLARHFPQRKDWTLTIAKR